MKTKNRFAATKAFYFSVTGFMILLALIVLYPQITNLSRIMPCPELYLPDRLEPMADGDCLTAGIIILNATNNPSRCVRITNPWWQGDREIRITEAIELSKGY